MTIGKSHCRSFVLGREGDQQPEEFVVGELARWNAIGVQRQIGWEHLPQRRRCFGCGTPWLRSTLRHRGCQRHDDGATGGKGANHDPLDENGREEEGRAQLLGRTVPSPQCVKRYDARACQPGSSSGLWPSARSTARSTTGAQPPAGIWVTVPSANLSAMIDVGPNNDTS